MPCQQQADPKLDITKLPAEIRRQIYSWVVGNRLIHIYQRRGDKAAHYLCQSKESDGETNDSYEQPPDNDSGDRWQMPVREKALGCSTSFCSLKDPRLLDPHSECRAVARNPWTSRLNLCLLRVSSECHSEGTQLLYATNTFSFDHLSSLRVWIVSLSPTLRAYVQHIRLELHLRGEVTGWGDKRSCVSARWAEFCDMMAPQLPRLRTLDVGIWLASVEIEGQEWRMLEGRVSEAMFGPLRRLDRLRRATVVVNVE